LPTPLSLPPLEALEAPGRTLEEHQAFALALEQLAEHNRQCIRKLSAAPSTSDRVRELAAQGFDDSEIAAQLGIRRDYVARLRGQAKIPAAMPRGTPRTPWRQVMTEMLEQGKSAEEMAEATGVSVRTAQNRLSMLRREVGGPKRTGKR
jgi:hypothetical protein